MNKQNTLPASRLENRFADGKPLYSDTEARIEANRCLFCYDAPCIKACPAAVNIPVFIHKIVSGNIRGAALTVFETNLLGVSTARVCPVEVSCAGACVLNEQNGQPVNIGRLQRYATEKGLAEAEAKQIPLFTPAKALNQSVALIGAGPASLSCAATLALGGVKPVIYEKRALPGGLNVSGIAPYKLDSVSAMDEIERLLALGIHLKTGYDVGVAPTVGDLQKDHEAIFLGVGLGRDKFPGIEGESLEGVWGATDLIRKIKNEESFTLPDSMKVLVIGGGNTAIDIARELAMLGAETVDILYRRTEKEMPGYHHELRKAKQYGVRLRENLLPKAIRKNENTGLLLEVENKLTKQKDILKANWIVMAIGQENQARRLLPALDTDKNGNVKLDPDTGETSIPGVYAGGDCVNGGKEVVNAVADGRKAAFSILKKLSASH